MADRAGAHTSHLLFVLTAGALLATLRMVTVRRRGRTAPEGAGTVPESAADAGTRIRA
ncbi:hypothetical protein ACH4VX_32865 [Streptomyces sp. NPDC020731]|uniref:hypothetical protein n=1 Tax=Streptomyces sp. NPDC020731 TaxID=3365085 RepID=UPI0037B720C7